MKKIISDFMIVIYSIFIFSVGCLFTAKKAIKYITFKQKRAEKFERLFFLMNDWFSKQQQGKTIARYLEKKGYHSIAIYGMGDVGQCLANELKDSNIKVIYGIDRREVTWEFPIYKIEKPLPKVDAVIVTALVSFEIIEEELKAKMDCPIYSMEDIIYFME